MITFLLQLPSKLYKALVDINKPSDTLRDMFNNKVITENTTILVFGERLDNDHDDIWTRRFRIWLSQGAKIIHLSINPSATTEKVLAELRGEFSNLKVYTIKQPQLIQATSLQKFIQTSENVHFTVWENPNMVWIEGHHAEKEEIAYRCEFIPAKDTPRDSRYLGLKERFKALLAESIRQQDPEFSI